MSQNCLPTFLRFLAGFLLSGTFVVTTAWGRTLEEIRLSQELRVCVAGSSAAFYQANAEAFARYLGVPAKVRTLNSWDEQFLNRAGKLEREGRYVSRLLENGECDLFPNDLHVLDWRESKMALVPYYTVRKMIVAHQKLRPSVREPADLAGLTAAVQKNTSYDLWLQNENSTSFAHRPVRIEHHPTAESVQLVSRGLVDFTVTGSEGAFKWMRSGEYDNLDLLFPVDDILPVGWGIAPAAADLREALERYFTDSLRAGSELDRSWQQYYGISRIEYKFFEQSLDVQAVRFAALRDWALPVGTGFAGILAAMMLWTGRLRREVASHQRTATQLARSEQAHRQEANRRLAVAQVQLALQQAATQEDLAQTLLIELSKHIPFQHGLLCKMDDGNPLALARYASQGDCAEVQLLKSPALAGLLQEACASRQDMLVRPNTCFGLQVSSSLGTSTPSTVLIHPIVGHGRVAGALELATTDAFTTEDRALLDDLRPFVALCMEKFQD